ncbi:hypothetical protein [Streptomyces regalis]|uniref:Uncharacterized protein n=1 Tax=Streptomyces regalis TaxID=68262 RepID=A0A0X3UW70_9ACTN|nr:hypothetical protein [Streptomyces regalis]KUL36457.1 hypothetical protein ADL12_19010 [Streptomyces regalis]
MNDDEQRQGAGAQSEPDFEEQVRELLAEGAYTIHPSPAPYPAIRRRGMVERRRRVAAAGAVLVTLAAMPVGAYALSGGGAGGGVATTPTPSVSATRAPSPAPSPTPSGPARPATKGQLLDGVTFEQAADGLEKCLAYQRSGSFAGDTDLGTSEDYRILLAMRSTGDSNTPGDGMYVVAVNEKPQQIRLICNIKEGEAQGLSTRVGNDADAIPDEGPVFVDPNNGKLYQQSFLDRGNWKLPFRWGIIGTVKSSVTKVTVSYGDSSAEAGLDHGWFVASGVLNEQVTVAPHIKGYDADGKLVYDSDEDKYYERTLP